MRIPEALRTEKAQHVFEAVMIWVVLLILPALPLGKHGGGVAMLVASIIGLAAYFAFYGTRLRDRGQLKWAVLAILVGVATSLSLMFLYFGRTAG